mgnify:CR=1 FL=1
MPFSPSDAWLQGLGAAFVQLAAGEFSAAVRGTHTSPVRALGKWLIDALPTPLIDVAIALLRRGDKPAIAIALTLFSLGVPAMAATAGTATLMAALLLSGLLGLYALWRRTELSRTTAAPLGLGTAVLLFAPGGMSFDDYFGFSGCDELEMAIRFLVGLSPAMLQRGYVVDQSRISLTERRGPSSIAACQLCAGVAAVETLKLLLHRQPVKLAPWGTQFDAYRMRYTHTWRPGGYRPAPRPPFGAAIPPVTARA